MAEISKEMKIVLIINIIVGVIYGAMYLFMPEAISEWTGATAYYNPHLSRIFGGTLLVLIIGAIIALKRGDWETLKPLFEVVILWGTMIIIINIVDFAILPMSARLAQQFIFDTIIVAILVVINIYFYLREEK